MKTSKGTHMVQDCIGLPDLRFDYEPGSKMVFRLDGWTIRGDSQSFHAFQTFGSFDSAEEALVWLEKTGFKPHPKWDTEPDRQGIYLYTAEEGREPLIINGETFLALAVGLSVNPPLPVLYRS